MLYFITLPWALFVGGLGLIGVFQSGQSMFVALIFMAVGFGPLVVQIRRSRSNRAKAKAAHAAMLASAGVAPGAGFDHAEAGSGVAVSRSARTLSLRLGETWKTYPFTDVRGWETNKEQAGQVIAGNVSGAMAALGPNLRASQEAAAATGLFVTVRDIDNPKWRIAMSNTQTQARWMEILQQAINEG